jgi:hypothetical protein
MSDEFDWQSIVGNFNWESYERLAAIKREKVVAFEEERAFLWKTTEALSSRSTEEEEKAHTYNPPSKEQLERLFEEGAALRDEYLGRVKKSGKEDSLYMWSCLNSDCAGTTPLVITSDGDLACPCCGLVKYARLDEQCIESQGVPLRLHGEYDPMSHLGEKLAQAVGETPPIPRDLLALLDDTYRTGDYPRHEETLSRDAIARIIADTPVPGYLAYKHRSNRYKKALCKDLHRQKYYSERWVYLRWHWVGVKPPTMNPTLRERLRLLFALFVTAFSESRHKTDCTRKPACHKRKNGCDKNIPPYYFIIGHLFRVICNTEKKTLLPRQMTPNSTFTNADLFRLYMPYMPCLRLGTYRKYNNAVRRTFEVLGWSQHFMPITFDTQWTHEWVFGLRPK